MKVRSLAHRVIAIVLTAQLLCAIALSGFTLVREAHAHLRAFDVVLEGRSDSLLGAIQDAEDVNSTVRIDPAELRVAHEDVFAVYNQGGDLLGSSPHAPSILTTREQSGFRTVRWHGQRYRVRQKDAMRVIDRAEFGGVGLQRPVTILYASPENHVWHAVLSSASYSLVAILLAAALTMVFVWFCLRTALRPLGELADAAGRIELPSLQFAAPASVLAVRELRPLAEVLSESTARLRGSFEKEQQFFGDAAHELKTAIAVVRSSLQVLMLRLRSPEEYASGLSRVLEDNVRVEALASKMLQLASVSEFRETDAGLLDLGEVAREIAKELRFLAEERQVQVDLQSDSSAIVILSRERAKALISNLLLNALQHSSSGMIVHVSVAKVQGGEVVLTVADCGSGIAPEALPHIFDRFYREDRARSRETGGTGLGLSICKAIVDAAGGRIAVRSTVNTGTRMTVTFSAA